MHILENRAQKYYPELDFAKGFAIALVVLAHCIQCGSGEEYYNNLLFFDNVIYKVVYTFHMPLLMVISGFLLAHNIDNKSAKQIIISRVKNILVPIGMWNLIVLLRHVTTMNTWEWLTLYCKTSLTSFWFLWAVLFSTIGVVVIYKCGNNKWYWYLLTLFITFVTPDMWNSECYKFMYPCFLFGFYIKKSKLIKRECYKRIFLIAIVLWLFLMLLYGRDSYIYTTGWTLLHKENPIKMFFLDIYRVIIGVAGSVVVLCAAFKTVKLTSQYIFCKTLINFGKCSIGIYIISAYINIVLQKITSKFVPNMWIILFETIVILLGTYTITRVIQINKWTAKLLLGGRKA